MTLEVITLRNFGLGRFLVAVWDGDNHIGEIEYRGIPGVITEIYNLRVRPEHRGKGYARRMLQEVVKNPKARITGIESNRRDFWLKVMPNSVTFVGGKPF